MTPHPEKIPNSDVQSPARSSYRQPARRGHSTSPLFQHLNWSGGWVAQPPLAPSRNDEGRVRLFDKAVPKAPEVDVLPEG